MIDFALAKDGILVFYGDQREVGHLMNRWNGGGKTQLYRDVVIPFWSRPIHSQRRTGKLEPRRKIVTLVTGSCNLSNSKLEPEKAMQQAVNDIVADLNLADASICVTDHGLGLVRGTLRFSDGQEEHVVAAFKEKLSHLEGVRNINVIHPGIGESREVSFTPEELESVTCSRSKVIVPRPPRY